MKNKLQFLAIILFKYCFTTLLVFGVVTLSNQFLVSSISKTERITKKSQKENINPISENELGEEEETNETAVILNSPINICCLEQPISLKHNQSIYLLIPNWNKIIETPPPNQFH